MTKSADMAQGRDAADASAEFGRLAADALQGSSSLPFHQLMTNPAAAMAAATAIGFGFSTQMAGAFWSAVHGAVEATNKFAAALEEPKTSASAVAPEIEIASPAEATTVAKTKPKAATKVRRTRAASTDVVVPVLENPVVEEQLPEKKVTRGRKAAVKPDDLKRISGVGPKLETVLKQRGVQSFADIASWSDADVARVDAEFGFEGRIARDDWVGQARTLLASKGAGAK